MPRGQKRSIAEDDHDDPLEHVTVTVKEKNTQLFPFQLELTASQHKRLLEGKAIRYNPDRATKTFPYNLRESTVAKLNKALETKVSTRFALNHHELIANASAATPPGLPAWAEKQEGGRLTARGFGRALRSVGKTIVQAIPKPILNRGLDQASHLVGDAAGAYLGPEVSGPVSSLTRTGLNRGVGYLEGGRITARGVGRALRSAGKTIVKAIPKPILNRGVDQASRFVGDAAGAYFGPEVSAPVSSLTKTGLNRGVGYLEGGALRKGSPEAHARMAHLRSLRKIKGKGLY
jgi:hypothetical protein